MNKPCKVELLYFPGCPNVAETKAVVKKVLASLTLSPLLVEEVNIHDPACPHKYRKWPSPSVLVNGEDIEEYTPNGAAACRIYDGKRGVPQGETIEKALTAALR